MCGICGQFNLDPVSEREIRAMTDNLDHRGPDENGVYVKDNVGLGHCRVRIIDLDTGQQPMSNEDDTVWITYNGEIYNYQELRSELLKRGHRFKSQADTETIIHLYEDHGVDCLKYLRGAFAFAIWDARKRRIFAARDRAGQKPLFYAQRRSGLMFASEIKSMLAVNPSLNELDLVSLDEYLTLRLIAPPRSMFKNVHKLPPAHYLTFDHENGLEINRYWDLNYEPKLTGSDEDLIDELEQRLVDCIKVHLVSDVPPLGAFLSAGLDSTLIVSLLKKHKLAEEFLTFSIGLDYGQYDEAPTAKLVAERYGTSHHEEYINPSLLSLLPKLTWHLDEPADPISICIYLAAQFARKHVKVVLDGTGGDELFGGYDRYYGYQYADYYAQIPQVLRRYLIGPILGLLPEAGWYKSFGHQLKWLHRQANYSGSDRYVQGLAYFQLHQLFKESLYGPVMQQAQEEFDPGVAIREAFERVKTPDPVDRMLYADLQIHLPDNPVMIADRMTMAHGLEARSPFMDHEIAEFAARLPARLKTRGRQLRYIQFELAKRYVPPEVLARKKQGFASALPYLLRDELNLLYGIFLRDTELAHDGILVQEPINQMIDEHLAGKIDHSTRLWVLLNSEVWYRMYAQGHSSEQLSAQIQTVSRAN